MMHLDLLVRTAHFAGICQEPFFELCTLTPGERKLVLEDDL
jgi:hypothetical protein